MERKGKELKIKKILKSQVTSLNSLKHSKARYVNDFNQQRVLLNNLLLVEEKLNGNMEV